MVRKLNNPRKQNLQHKKKLFVIVALITVLKLLIIPFTPRETSYLFIGAWLGSDGEQYLEGMKVLAQDGIFSESSLLTYYAPGYSFFLYLLSIISGKFILLLTSFIQTIIYSYSIYFLSLQLLQTKLKKVTTFFASISLLNPTLSLATLVIGYESLLASFSALIIGLFIKYFISAETNSKNYLWYLSAIFFGISIWLSPRIILSSIVFIILWFLFTQHKRRHIIGALLSVFIILSFQGILMARNQVAIGYFTSQTSLGDLMIMGAGPDATGKYMIDSSSGILCDTSDLNPSDIDKKQVTCVLNWYLQNPVEGSFLLWKKSYYLWSPWYGPLSGGTSGRNPYLLFHPIKTSITSDEQLILAAGPLGQIISWLWIIGGWFLMFYGARELIKSKGIERILSFAVLGIIFSSWLGLLAIHGDNRYRIPFMPLSLLLQVYGYHVLKRPKLFNN